MSGSGHPESGTSSWGGREGTTAGTLVVVALFCFRSPVVWSMSTLPCLQGLLLPFHSCRHLWLWVVAFPWCAVSYWHRSPFLLSFLAFVVYAGLLFWSCLLSLCCGSVSVVSMHLELLSWLMLWVRFCDLDAFGADPLLMLMNRVLHFNEMAWGRIRGARTIVAPAPGS